MSPPTTIRVDKPVGCSFICHNDPSIISRESMLTHKLGQTFKLLSYVVTMKTRLSSLNLINSFLSPNNISMQIWCRKPY